MLQATRLGFYQHIRQQYGEWLITIEPTSTARVYDVFWRTNLIPESTPWNPYNFNTTGNSAALNFIVTNELDLKFYRTGVKIQ